MAKSHNFERCCLRWRNWLLMPLDTPVVLYSICNIMTYEYTTHFIFHGTIVK